MPLNAIDKFKPKNNGTFKIMDAVDVDYDGTGASSIKEKIDEALTKSGSVNVATNDQIDEAIANLGK